MHHKILALGSTLICIVSSQAAFANKYVTISGRVRAFPNPPSQTFTYIPLPNQSVIFDGETAAPACVTDANGVFKQCKITNPKNGSFTLKTSTLPEWSQCDLPMSTTTQGPDGTFSVTYNCPIGGGSYPVFSSQSFDALYQGACPQGDKTSVPGSVLCKKKKVTITAAGDEYIEYSDIDGFLPKPWVPFGVATYRSIPVSIVGFDNGKEVPVYTGNGLTVAGKNYACEPNFNGATTNCIVAPNSGNGRNITIEANPNTTLSINGHSVKSEWLGFSLTPPASATMLQKTVAVPMPMQTDGWPAVKSIKVFVGINPALANSDPSFFYGDIDGDGIPNGEESESSSVVISGLNPSYYYTGSMFVKDNPALNDITQAKTKAAYVRQQFRDLLHREPSNEAGLESQMAKLTTNADRGLWTASIFWTEESKFKFNSVFALYLAANLESYLLLEKTATERNREVKLKENIGKITPGPCNSVDTCAPLASPMLLTLAQAMVNENLFLAKYGFNTGAAFVNNLFMANLGRQANSQEHTALDGLEQGKVLKYLVMRTEYMSLPKVRNRLMVIRGFLEMMDRLPNPSAYTYWVSRLDQGLSSDADFFNAVIQTPEYHDRLTTFIDTIAPSTPTGLAQDSAQTELMVFHWNASSDNVGVKNYEVYRT